MFVQNKYFSQKSKSQEHGGLSRLPHRPTERPLLQSYKATIIDVDLIYKEPSEKKQSKLFVWAQSILQSQRPGSVGKNQERMQ